MVLIFDPEITEPPRISEIDFGADTFEAGDIAQAHCLVRKGDRPLTISWLRNDEYIVSNGDLTINNMGGRTSIITLDPVGSAHAGIYACQVVNAAGTSISRTSLSVNGYFLKIASYQLLLFFVSLLLNVPPSSAGK